MNHYRVKFKHSKTKKTIFGIVNNSQRAKEDAGDGHCMVEDAIIPKRYRVLETDITDIPLSVTNLKNGDKYDKHIKVAFEKAQATSDALPDEGVHVGNLFSIAVADGYAWYVVYKVNKKTCYIEWRGFCTDRYKDCILGYGGKFPIQHIQRFVESAQLFTKTG